MGLLGGGGGDDRLQIQLATFGIVISIMVSAMLPILVPTNVTGYSLDEIYRERASLEIYTGESMINQAPYVLQHVYTPYTVGEPYNLTEEGWLYGTELKEDDQPSFVMDGEQQIGKTEIRLDPSKKSDVPLYSGTVSSSTVMVVMPAAGGTGSFWGDVWEYIEGLFSFGISRDSEVRTETYPTWNFSGYRYELDPMLRIATNTDGQPTVDTRKVDDAKLSIVWYDLDGQEGISGGLVLYNSKTNAILASYTAAEIVAQYNPLSQNAAKFKLDFNGTVVSMWLRFDPDVLINNLDLSQAFSQGKWTIAFTSSSADAYLDLQNSNSFTASLGSMLETYINIFTLDIPNLSTEWNLVLWVICIMPVGLSVILFLSRFGLAGSGAGILGMAFAGGVLL